MRRRASVCVLLLAVSVLGGCATTTNSAPERVCERVETVWGEETQQTRVVEYGCVMSETVKERQVWVILFQILSMALAVASLAI